MKRLNKKGFTLVELLAVIIILAVVVGITIPTVLSVTDTAKKSSFDTAVTAIKSYIQSQVDMSQLSPEFRDESKTPYVDDIAKASASTDDLSSKVLTNTGYTANITKIGWTVDPATKIVTITCATANEDSGQYLQSDTYSAC